MGADDDKDSVFGTSQSSFISAALVNCYLSLSGPDAQVPAPHACTGSALDVERSAILHSGWLPPGLDWAALIRKNPQIEHFSYKFSDEHSKQGFAFIHSGYAYGGDRENLDISNQGSGARRNARAKISKPEDCSSWVAKVAGLSEFSTDHLYKLYRLQSTIACNLVTTEKEDIRIAAMQAKLEARALPENPTIENIVPSGMVFGYRNFKAGMRQCDSLGSSGHVTLTIGNTRNAQILTLGYNRSMPDIEGFGVQTFPLIESERRANFLFNIKGS